ncbi:MAG: alpha-glucosidase C-terminal domain-containing protein, partial [Treponema sp.]|nr:alpha-glucosidase C-terminal domain-containing protein [Treponema sp.]
CLLYGEFIPVYADNKLIIYQRKYESELYTIALNFSSNVVKVPKKFAGYLPGTQVVSVSGEKYEGSLPAWDGVLVKLA